MARAPLEIERERRRLGLQRRIMLYVAVGLALMFGVLVFLGLGAIQQATDLVFRERLATAHTTASILERDLERLAVQTREETLELVDSGGSGGPSLAVAAVPLLDELDDSPPSPFFSVSGVWLLDGRRITDSAGDPPAPSAWAGMPGIDGAMPAEGWLVSGALGPVAGALPFAAVVVALDPSSGDDPRAVVVHTVSTNSTAAYLPATHGGGLANADGEALHGDASEAYHLEVVDPGGIAILGIGQDERPGAISPHARAIAGIVREGRAAALLHEPAAGDPFEPHVMAVVPLASTPFWVVLEQPVDVALALPIELRQRLLVWTTIAFLATLGVAWLTTRRVVGPTEELTAAAVRIASGDLESHIDVRAQDEIGVLAQSLEVMRQHLNVAYETVERNNRELETRVAERTARLGDVLRQTMTAQEDERHRLARELHDETAQTLAALSIALDRARDTLATAPDASAGQIGQAKEIATRLLAETRLLILGLRPAALDDLGLVPALRWQCEAQLGELGVRTTIDDQLGGVRLPSTVEVSLFRIAQEAVSNIARHARASHIWIRLARSDGQVTLSVRDDGRGFDHAASSATDDGSRHFGLLGMHERVTLLDGTMDVRSEPGAGTVVTIRVPVLETGA